MGDQATLGNFGAGSEPEPDTPRVNVLTLKHHLDDDAEPFNNKSCPWCCAPPRKFIERDNGIVGCTSCDSAIPVGKDWYERGEKIVDV